MWSLEVSLRFWAEDRAVWSLGTSPPCPGFCCLFAALQTRAPLSWLLGRRGAALGHSSSGGHWKYGPSSVPRTGHLGRLPAGISGYSMARPTLGGCCSHLISLGTLLLTEHSSPLPALLPCTGISLGWDWLVLLQQKSKGGWGKNNYNKNTPFFPLTIATRWAHLIFAIKAVQRYLKILEL